MAAAYVIPAQTKIGHVHLKVSDLERSIDFYCRILGFELVSRYGPDAAFVSAGGYHHHIGLNTWYSKNTKPIIARAPGLFHAAILYPERKDLAMIYERLMRENYPLTGVADHGVSEAVYLSDPDENGLELYWDKPREKWPVNKNGDIQMYTIALDVFDLLSELEK